MTSQAGPLDASVLYLQGTHLSSSITSNNLDTTLRIRRSDNLLWELWRNGIHHRVRSCLNDMGFYGLLCCGDCAYDSHLITALVERWRRETHTFHLRVGEATITLQDVALIWGLPVDGEPIIGHDISYSFPILQSHCYDWLGFLPIETDFRANCLKMSTLYLHCVSTEISDQSTEVDVAQFARCVAMMIIGGCLIPDSEGCAVKMIYLHFIQDIRRVRTYSWGSAVLAFLYRELCAASTIGKHEIAGPLYLLQIWAWSRFTSLSPDRLGYNLNAVPQNPMDGDDILPFPPYGSRWRHMFRWTHTATHSVRIIRDILDRMGSGQFLWMVYDLDASYVVGLPMECRNPILWRSVCPLICYHIVEMHRPNRVLRQFGMSQIIPYPALDGDGLHDISRRGRKNCNWTTQHGQHVDAWSNRHNLVVQSQLVEDFDMRYDYASWYDSVTRRFISPVEAQQIDSGYEPGDAYFRRVVRDETANIRNLFADVDLDDQSSHPLVERVRHAIQSADMLHEMAIRAPDQQAHREQPSRRRQRRRRTEDVPSAELHGIHSTTVDAPSTSVIPPTSDGFYSTAEHAFTPDFHSPQPHVDHSFTEMLFGDWATHPNDIGYSGQESTFLGYSGQPSGHSGQQGGNGEEEEAEDVAEPSQPLRRSTRVPHPRDCGTGHRLGPRRR